VQEIAARLALPIRVSLSYVPKNFTPGNTDGFRSSSLARTDWRGHGIEGITAQVSIPQQLPMFGTSALQGYPIQVRVSEDCYSHPQTFVAIMAHELSHVLLAAMWSTFKDSELHTDLVPILLGFRDAVQRGRKTVESTVKGRVTTTRTTTFGYLTDSQFKFACGYVTRILQQHRRDKKHLVGILQQGHRRLRRGTRALSAFRDYFGYVDTRLPGKMRAEHAQRFVQLHTRDHSEGWDSRFRSAKTSFETAESFLRGLDHYTSSAVDRLKVQTRAVEVADADLRKVTEAVLKDEKLLRRYVGVVYRLRRFCARLLKNQT
jgi:hypothetical protein